MSLSVISISFTPARSPKLFAFYLMNKREFENKYEHKFKINTTINLSNREITIGASINNYDLELYLPNCDIEIYSDTATVNAYKVICKDAKFCGCIDILKFVENVKPMSPLRLPKTYSGNKRARLLSEETYSPIFNEDDTYNI